MIIYIKNLLSSHLRFPPSCTIIMSLIEETQEVHRYFFSKKGKNAKKCLDNLTQLCYYVSCHRHKR